MSKIRDLYSDIFKNYKACLLINDHEDFLEIIPVTKVTFAATYLDRYGKVSSEGFHSLKSSSNYSMNYKIIDFIPKIDCNCDRFLYDVIKNSKCPHEKEDL